MKKFNEENKRNFNYKKGAYGFHGDVGIFCEDLPENFEQLKKCETSILAYGEHTGHCHKLFGDDIDLREDDRGNKYLRLVSPVVLKHQEHAPVEIPPGTFRIGIQKEYDHFTKITRQVAD